MPLRNLTKSYQTVIKKSDPDMEVGEAIRAVFPRMEMLEQCSEGWEGGS